MEDKTNVQHSDLSGNYYDASLENKKLSNAHEENVLDKKNQHELALKELENKYELNRIKKELGFMGQFFGKAENSSKNITASICLVLLIMALILSCILYGNEDTITMEKLWETIFPIITLSLGYLFGKK